MSNLDTNYVVNLDLVKDRVNSVMKFGLADVETSDFYLGLYNNGSRVFDKDYIVTLYIVKPNGNFRNIELEPKVSLKKYYCNLPDTLKNIPGEYLCQAIIFDNLTGEKKISKSKFKYSVDLDLASEMAGIIDEEEQENILTDILNRLLTLENPVEPYATQKHVDESVSTLTKEIDTIKVKDVEQDGKLSNIETKDTEQDNRLATIEAKDVEQDGRLNLLENKVDGIDEKIIDTIEPSLDNYGNKLDALETKDIEHEQRMTNIETKNTEQDNRLNTLENKDVEHELRMTDIETKNTEQDERLNAIETKNTEQDNRLDIAENRLANIGDDITNTMQPIIDEYTSRLDAIKAIDVAQNNRLDAIEAKNQQQDDRLLDIEKTNKRQDMDLKCLFTEAKNNMMDITEEGNNINLQNSTEGHVFIDELKGNTMVNCNKEPDKELILNGNINTSGDNAVTITEGVDGGLVDVALEGNTMVNVCDQKDPVAITKSYTVETGNHVALQGEYDGKCRPVVNGNTLWIDNDTEDVLTAFDGTKNLRLQSSFEDKVVTQKMVENGEEVAENLGKYKVDYVVTGKNKFNFNNQEWLKGYSFAPNYGEKNGIVIENNSIKLTLSTSCVGCYIKLKPNTQYYVSCRITNTSTMGINDANLGIVNKAFTTDSSGVISFGVGVYGSNTNDGYVLIDNIQIEEGTVVTPYEPYKEFTKTFYLNSPLLEGDTIEEKDGGIYHVHRYGFMNLYDSTNPSTIWGSDGTINGINWFWSNTLKNGNLGAYIVNNDTAYKTFSDKIAYIRQVNAINIGFPEGILTSNDDAGVKAWIQENNPNVVYKLATPQYEVISQNDTILCDSYVNGHLDVDSAVPVEKVDFLHFEKDLTYLYANTQYTVQFTLDKAITVDITLGGKELLAQSIVEGLNKITITTPETLVDNKLIIDGVGANISEVVVTNTDQDFGYFEGMKSVGECEGNKIKTLSKNSLNEIVGNGVVGDLLENPDGNIADGGTADMYFSSDIFEEIEPNTQYYFWHSKDGAIYNTGQFIYFYDENKKLINRRQEGCTSFISYPNAKYLKMMVQRFNTTNIKFFVSKQNTEPTFIDSKTKSNTQTLTHEPLRAVGDIKDKYVLIDGKWYIERNCGVRTYQEGDIDNYITDKINTVYPLSSPTYEPIDYNPFTVYSDITHISNNSTIPCNMIIKNHGYNCLLKPSTTYTVSSNLGLNTVTTPSVLTEDCLRFYDTDTSSKTTMKNVMVLEGDYTTGKPIPSHFSGIESAFEQEYDEAVGKYKVKAKVAGKNLFDINKTTVIGNILDKGSNYLIVNHATIDISYCCNFNPNSQYTLSWELEKIENNNIAGFEFIYTDGTSNYVISSIKGTLTSIPGKTISKIRITFDNFGKSKISNIQLEQGSKATAYEPYKESDITFYIDEPLRGIGDAKDRVYVKNDKVVVERNCGQREYQDGDFGTCLTDKVSTVYQLSEPTYEEVEYNDVKLFIESFKNSTLFYDSNIPVTSTVYYSYSVPIVDAVAQTANISDQQDSMIIDMATQVAVMEIMLM